MKQILGVLSPSEEPKNLSLVPVRPPCYSDCEHLFDKYRQSLCILKEDTVP